MNFAERLKSLREHATADEIPMSLDGAWNKGYGIAPLIVFLVNHSEQLGDLVEAALPLKDGGAVSGEICDRIDAALQELDK
jgi:hypothetical protein